MTVAAKGYKFMDDSISVEQNWKQKRIMGVSAILCFTSSSLVNQQLGIDLRNAAKPRRES